MRVLASAVLVAAAGWAQEKITVDQLAERVVDLSHPVSAKFPTGTGPPRFQAEVAATIEKDGMYYRWYRTHEHFSTHLDAPAHFGKGQPTVDQLGPAKLFLPAVVIDIRPRVAINADYELSVDDALAWEKKNGAIPPGCAVLLNTGWSARAGDPAAYRNADADGVFHFPIFSLEAARLLVEQRKVAALGIDNFSVDHGPKYPVHNYSQPRGVYHLENLTNLDKLPPRVFLIAAPIKLEGGSGGQVRVWAVP